MEETKTFFVTLTSNVSKEFEITVPASVTKEEVDDWVDWERERIFNIPDRSFLESVELEEIIGNKRVNVSASLGYSSEDIDIENIFELKGNEE